MRRFAIEVLVLTSLLLILFFLSKYDFITKSIYYGLIGGVTGGWVAEKATRYFKTDKIANNR